MARVGEVNLDPENLVSISDTLNRIIQIVDQEIEFGDPNDPINEASGTKTTGAATTHNGRVANIRGSWVEHEFTSLTVPGTGIGRFWHNLDIPVVTGEPNVRWMCNNFRHSGAGSNNAASVALVFDEANCSINKDWIELRLHGAATRTIDADNPVRVSIFFVPATRWP